MAKKKSQAMAPLVYRLSEEQLMERLIGVIEAKARAGVVEQNFIYLRVEFRSRWFGFVDDVEFLICPKRKELHFRSASRLGLYDFGVNRRRMAGFCAELTESLDIDLALSS